MDTKNIKLSNETKEDFILCDAALQVIAWINDGRDIELKLILADDNTAILRCSWVDSLEMDIHSKTREIGIGFTWETQVEKKADRWQIILDFASNGIIKFECSAATLTFKPET